MFLTTIISFLGGNAFRMIWGEISDWWKKSQDHKYELQMIELQGKLDAEKHAREMESVKLQHDLGVEVIRVQGQQYADRVDVESFAKMSESTTKLIGIWFVDAWNGLIRPVGATMFLSMIALHYYKAGWVLDETGWAMAGAFLGIYVADRSLMKRGK